MSLTLGDVVAVLDRHHPPETAQSWDRVGLVTGDPTHPVRRIHAAVDPTLAVVDEARRLRADLLVTHHPLLLRGVHSVATTNAKGRTVTDLISSGVALYVAHTNADVADPGVNTALADALGLQHVEPLVVELEQQAPAERLAVDGEDELLDDGGPQVEGQPGLLEAGEAAFVCGQLV